MVRKRFLINLITFMASTAVAGVQEAKTDLAWTDIGDSIIKVEDEAKVQRDYNSINQTEGLLAVGSFIRLARDINLRVSPAGEGLGPLLKGQDFQILEVQIDEKRKRFYKVKSDKGIGYIYAGTKRTYAKWTRQIWSTDAKVMAQAGDLVKVKRKKGLKISKSPNEKSFYSIPRGAELQVESIDQTEEGKVFYKVKYKSKSGFAYFGDAETLASNKAWNEVY
jgi:hypothetical protein